MQKDITTKEIIQSITKDIAKYILHINIDDNIKFIDKELKRVEKREADIVAKCKISNIDTILHIEIQNSNDNSMALRMLRYYTDIKTIHPNTPIKQYLIYIGKNRLNMPKDINDDMIKYRYNIVDMHNINCQELLKLDNPEALVLSILCDFQNSDEIEILKYIIQRLKELTKENENSFGKYMLILETLSTNRDLRNKLKEAESMLRDIRYEDLPSYEIGYESGIQKGIQKGIKEGIQKGEFNGILKSAKLMVERFNLSIESVSKELNIPLDELKRYIEKDKRGSNI